MLMKTETRPARFAPASRIASIGVSEILQIGARAAAMRAAGENVIILGAGEPDFDTPDNIKQAAWRAIQRGETKYTALDGAPAMKEAVREKFRRENGLLFTKGACEVGTVGALPAAMKRPCACAARHPPFRDAGHPDHL